MEVPLVVCSKKPSIMKKTLTSLLVGAACLAGSLAQAQVLVNSTETFDAVPPVTSWSTRSVPGAGGAPATLVDLTALVQTNTATLINTALGTSGTVPPSSLAIARQNSTALYVQTRPTGNAATILMATITNSTGVNLPTPKISYDFLLPSAVAGEDAETAGHVVYYSLTGAENSWVQIPELTSAQPTPVAGALFLDLNLGAWPAGSLLYIIWLDDNGGPGTDGSFAIDNFSISGELPPPPTIATQPSNTTNIVRRTVRLSVTANGVGIQYVWNKVGVGAIDPLINPSAATRTLVITNALESDTGEYFVSVSSPYGSVDSSSAHIQIDPDTFAPRLLAARLGANPNQVILVVDEELCNNGEACGTVFTDLPILTFIISEVNAPDEQLGVLEASSVNGTNIILTTETAWDVEKVYRITISHDNNGISDLGGVVTPAGTFVDTLPVATSVVVGPTGSATYTFDAAPGNLEFSTGAFAGGADGTTDTAALFDAKVQTLDKSVINFPIAEAAGTPPGAAGQAQWASAGGYLITRPTGTAGNVIMAHLRNKSGTDRTAIDISYNLTVENTVVEEVTGHLVYFSFSGTPNTWTQIPGISGDRVTGLKTASLDFSGTPWVTEADIYILFADDNGSGSPDDALEIDNFKVSFIGEGIAPTITQNPSNVTTNEGSVVHLSVAATGSPTLVYQWFKGATALADGGNISGAATSRLTISNAAPADAGSYTVRVNNSTPPAATSTAAVVTINPDTTRPVLTRAVSVNSTTISLTFSKQLSAGAALASHYTVSGATVTSAVLANGTANAMVTLTTSARAAGNSNSTLTITGLNDTRIGANLINPNPTVVALTTVQVIESWGGEWSYNTNNLDANLDWTTTGGEGWLMGNGLFGTEPQAATIAAFPTPIVTVIPPPNAANEFLTSYFRKTVTLPPLPAGMSYALNHIIDDGAVFYVDGAEIGRFNMPAGAVNYLTVATVASTEGVLLPLRLAASAGSHTIAVSVHQSVNTSSDIVFGAQIVTVPTVSPALTVAQNGTNTLVSWTADSSWALVGSTNVAGPYTAVGGAPFRTLTTPSAQPAQFYRLRYAPQP